MILTKFKNLVSYLRELDSLIVAFSGGVDSSFLLAVAKDNVKGKVIAVTSISSIHKRKEIENAKLIAKNIGVEHILLDFGELTVTEFVANDRDRCYHCKKNLFKKMWQIAKEQGISYIAHGANLDDMKDYRPGHKAAEEYNIISPLIDIGFKKDEIRYMVRNIGLWIWDRPSSPCLATRIPYGSIITKEKLTMIERAEDFLQDLGYKEVRVRHYGDIAKIEVPESQLDEIITKRRKIINRFKEIGFIYVSLDIEGFTSGKMNQTILKDKLNKKED